MPKPRSNKTHIHYTFDDMYSKYQKVMAAMNKLNAEIIGREPKSHRASTMMCAMNEILAKLELLNGK